MLEGVHVKVYVATERGRIEDLLADSSVVLETPDADVEVTSRVIDMQQRLREDGKDEGLVFIDHRVVDPLHLSHVIGSLNALSPGIPVVVAVSEDIPMEQVHQAMAAGAAAVVARQMDPDRLRDVVRMVRAGMRICAVPNDTVQRNRPHIVKLSERELQILNGICSGLQNKEIAHIFEIKEVTVKMHVRGVIRKLGARNRTHAVTIAFKLGLVPGNEAVPDDLD